MPVMQTVIGFFTSPAGVIVGLSVVGYALYKSGALKSFGMKPAGKYDSAWMGEGGKHLKKMFDATSKALKDASDAYDKLRGGQFKEFKAEFDKKLKLVDKLENFEEDVEGDTEEAIHDAKQVVKAEVAVERDEIEEAEKE